MCDPPVAMLMRVVGAVGRVIAAEKALEVSTRGTDAEGGCDPATAAAVSRATVVWAVVALTVSRVSDAGAWTPAPTSVDRNNRVNDGSAEV